MKNLITAIAVGAAIVLTAPLAMAQQAGPQGGTPGLGQGKPGKQGGGMQTMRRLQEEERKIFATLNLNERQRNEITALQQRQTRSRQELMQRMRNAGTDRSAMREEFQSLQRSYREGLQRILTNDQWVKYEAAVKAARERMKKERGAKSGPKPGKGAIQP